MANVIMPNAKMASVTVPQLNLVFLGLICFGFCSLMLSVTTESVMPNVVMPNATIASVAAPELNLVFLGLICFGFCCRSKFCRNR
jgi:hypothetical protein